MTSALAKYEAARVALAECRRVDEAKDIRDKAEAMRLYARQARDMAMELDAWEIRTRAERRLGEMLIAAREAGQLRKGRNWTGTGTDHSNGSAPEPLELPARVILKEAGVDRKLSATSQKVASISEQAFEAMVARTREEMAAARDKRALTLVGAQSKTERRAERERELAGRITTLPEKKYGVIYADPEWRFEPRSRDSGMDRAADNHYPTSSTDDICARPVGAIAADDCVLFLWATVPMLPDALKVMTAWGFAYRSHAIWSKDRIGTGYWFRNQHELLLVGTRGSPPAPAPGTQFSSVMEAPVGEHSRKPDDFYDLIETYFPNLPKIELNARRARHGWDAWGNEAPEREEESRAKPWSGRAAQGLESDEAGVGPPPGGRCASSSSENDDPQTSATGVTAGETAPQSIDEPFDPDTGEIVTPPAAFDEPALDIPDFLRRSA